MPTVAEMLVQAKACHHAGQLQNAVELYLRVVQADSTNVEAHYLLGAASYSLGQANEARTYFARAVSLNPEFVEAHYCLGIVHAETGKLDEAAACFQRAVELRPQFAEAHSDLGAVCERQGKLDEAAACFRRALERMPDLTMVHKNLGIVLEKLGNPDEAVSCFRRALEREPDDAELHIHLGRLLRGQDNLAEAVIAFRRAIELAPGHALAHFNLGAALHLQGNEDEAAACLRRAIQLKPDCADAYVELGSLLGEQGRFPEAIDCCRRALELQPDSVAAHGNLGIALHEQGSLDEAIACFQRAAKLDPDNAEVHYNHALTLLLMGKLDEGWPAFEWRFKRKRAKERAIPAPRWTGSSLAGRTIFLTSEYGLGDTLQFIRFVKRVRQQGATVMVEVQRQLVPLLEQSGFRDLVAQGTPLAGFDCYAPLMSLPGVFGTTLKSIPNRVPYLSADHRLVKQWRDALGETDNFRVGIAWQGNRAHKGDRFRSIPLACFAPLAITGVELISLQKGDGCEQLAGIATQFRVRDLGNDFDERHGTFMDTAAVIKNLDLVVTCDSAVAHLAGALGAPVWVALSFAPDWRWMLERTDTPWYPTMRLFRQKVLGNWDDVFQTMQRELPSVL